MNTENVDDSLRLEVPSRPPKPPSNYDYLTEIAMKVAIERLCEAIEMFEKLNAMKEFWLDNEELPKGMFNWSIDDWMARVADDSTSYDLVLDTCEPLTLEKKKTTINLKEIKTNAQLLVHKYLNNEHIPGVMDSMLFRQAIVDLQAQLEAERVKNDAISAFLVDQINEKYWEFKKRHFVDKRSYHNLIESVTLRYRIRFCTAHVDALEVHVKQNEDQQEDKLRQQYKTLDATAYCFQNSLTIYYSEIQSLKQRIEAMTEQFEREEAHMDNVLAETKCKLEKQLATRKYYGDELARFRRAKAEMMHRDENIRMRAIRGRTPRKEPISGSVVGKWDGRKSMGIHFTTTFEDEVKPEYQ